MDEVATHEEIPFNTGNFFLGPSTFESPPRQLAVSKNSSCSNRNMDDSDAISIARSTGTSKITPSTPLTLVEELQISNNSEEIISSNTKFVDDGYLALGTIKVKTRYDAASGTSSTVLGPADDEPYPNSWLSTASRRGWIRIEENLEADGNSVDRLRIFILPEDVDRGNRGSLKDFRKTVKRLLDCVDRSIDAWSGRDFNSQPEWNYSRPTTTQEESLFYIFNTLQSPCPNLSSIRTSVYGYQAVDNIIKDSIAGLVTDLYPYQRRSVAAMVQREAEPAKLLDPRKRIFKDMYGRPFYLDIHDGSLHLNPSFYTEPRGGILAETMGYGKTLICIALILATRGHYPKVPEDRVDNVPFETREEVGSLLSMAARRAKYEGVPWKAEFHSLEKAGYQFDRCVSELKKYHRQYAEPIFTPTTPNRAGKRESANIVRLCSATLIVVPPNLMVQWQHEIAKHTEPNALDVLILDSPAKDVPQWKDLMTYDVVIITKPRFEQEYRDDDLHQGKRRKGDAVYRSPLTDVRWLRVICDEGHGFAGSSSRTNAMAMLDKMYIERRWVVSGTPSSTLHGVEVGLSTTESSSNEVSSPSPSLSPVHDRQNSLTAALQKRRAPNARDLEAKDLERLRLIVVNFLRLQPWANQRGSSDVANWKRYLAPTIDGTGNNFTPSALRDVLQTLIIRHRIEDIDTDLMLPPLHNRVIYLKPSYHDKLSINMFLLVLASNYVTSEREDEDYMFHPRNRKKLDILINNLRQASFHWVGFTEHDISETLRISSEYLDKNIDRISDADGTLLTEAILNAERALNDPSWKAFATLHEIGVYITNFPAHAREAWALDGRERDPVLLGTVQAREVQKYVKHKVEKGAPDPLIGLGGIGVKAMNAVRSKAEEEQRTQHKNKSKGVEGEKQQVGVVEEPKLKAHSTSSLSQSRRSSISKKETQTAPLKRRQSLSKAEGMEDKLASTSEARSIASSGSDPPSLPSTKISSFTSSKLNYLVTRLLTLPSDTKSLVFYQHNNTAFFIAEALELLSIPFRIYANTLSVSQRNTYLSDFNSATKHEIKVLLMDVKQASHGLHVASASYVCIVSPIWDAGVESQAIKRAHRIGQTKKVVVETLVLKDTFEEDMVKRRRWKDEHLSDRTDGLENAKEDEKTLDSNTNKGRSLLDDKHMVSVIKDIKFLKFDSNEDDVRIQAKEMVEVPEEKRMLFGNLVVDEDSSSSISEETRPSDVTFNSNVTAHFRPSKVKLHDPNQKQNEVRPMITDKSDVNKTQYPIASLSRDDSAPVLVSERQHQHQQSLNKIERMSGNKSKSSVQGEMMEDDDEIPLRKRRRVEFAGLLESDRV